MKYNKPPMRYAGYILSKLKQSEAQLIFPRFNHFLNQVNKLGSFQHHNMVGTIPWFPKAP